MLNMVYKVEKSLPDDYLSLCNRCLTSIQLNMIQASKIFDGACLYTIMDLPSQTKTVDVTPIVPSMLGKLIRIVSDDGAHVYLSVRRRDSSNCVFPAFIFDGKIDAKCQHVFIDQWIV